MGNNKQIAKNTLLLQSRLFFSMIITLYTSRIVLRVLGIDDFGIYSVVGSVTMLMGFFSNSIQTTTQRFLNYEMGKENQQRLPDIFSVSLTGHYLIALVILVLAETVGLWIVYHLDIPSERFHAALWVYHFSVFAFIINIVTMPYNAAIIARERMTVYAVLSIMDVVSKLAIACIISYIVWDKLQLYAVLLFITATLVRLVYVLYCRKVFAECRGIFLWDTDLLKKIFGFSGWMLLGALANTLGAQGVTIVINQFFAPVYNAARAVDQQVSSAINNFAGNFMLAIHPPLVKAYSRGETDYMYKLVFFSSKISFCLLFMMTLPILLQTEYLLNLWLEKVPEHSILFTQLALVETLITSSYAPIAAVSQASGKIKYYQLTISVGFILLFGLTYLLYYLGFPAKASYILAIGIAAAGLIARLLVLRKIIGFPMREYFSKVTFRLLAIVACSVILPILYIQIANTSTLLNFIFIVLISILSISLFFFLFGLNSFEKGLLKKEIIQKIKK